MKTTKNSLNAAAAADTAVIETRTNPDTGFSPAELTKRYESEGDDVKAKKMKSAATRALSPVERANLFAERAMKKAKELEARAQEMIERAQERERKEQERKEARANRAAHVGPYSSTLQLMCREPRTITPDALFEQLTALGIDVEKSKSSIRSTFAAVKQVFNELEKNNLLK
jgi:hypothetical protein